MAIGTRKPGSDRKPSAELPVLSFGPRRWEPARRQSRLFCRRLASIRKRGAQRLRFPTGKLSKWRCASDGLTDRRRVRVTQLAPKVHAENQEEHLVEDQPGTSAGFGQMRPNEGRRAEGDRARKQTAVGKRPMIRLVPPSFPRICKLPSIASHKRGPSSKNWIAATDTPSSSGFTQRRNRKHVHGESSNSSRCWKRTKKLHP